MTSLVLIEEMLEFMADEFRRVGYVQEDRGPAELRAIFEAWRARKEAQQFPDGIHHRGWKFTAPFHCFLCGDPVSARQFAFSRSCGGCDVSNSRTARLRPMDTRAFAGPHELIGPTDDDLFIDPQWLDPATRDNYPRLSPIPRLKPRPRPKPKLMGAKR